MTDQRRILTIQAPKGDQRSDREVLLETNRLVHALAAKGAKTLEEIEHAIYIINQPITVLELSERTTKAMIEAEIATVRALLQESQTSLIRHPALGRLALREIAEVLAMHGLRLADTEPAPFERKQPKVPMETRKGMERSSQQTRETKTEPIEWKRSSSGRFDIRKGDLVRHPKKEDWGVGQVRNVTDDGVATITFERVGEKSISMRHVDMVHIGRSAAVADEPAQSAAKARPEMPIDGSKVLCSNCGQPTVFTENSSPQRYALGWCDACFKHSQRTFSDKVTGETRYFDELRTIDGIRHRYYSPK
jgi:hypothetical protein